MSERHSYSGQELPAPKVVDRGEGAVGRDGFPAVFTDIQKVVAFYVCRASGKPPGNTGFKERRWLIVASDHVTHLKREGIDKYAYLFMIPIINRLSEKYSFNREINDERIRRERLLLPATESGDIDFDFMSSFMKKVEKDILGTTLDYFQRRSNQEIIKRGG